MKKLYILAAAAIVSATAGAQTVNFVRNGEVIPNGTTLNFSERNIIEDLGDGLMYFTMDPGIAVVADEDMNISLKAECTSGQEIQMCYGECTTGQTVSYNSIPVTANVPLETQFEYICNTLDGSEMPDYVTTELSVNKAMSLGMPLSKITVVMDVKNAAVTVLEADKSFSYADGEIRYDAGAGMKCGLFDAEGKCVLDTRLSGTGVISTEGLARGIYVYRLGDKSGKIFVK